MCRVPGNRFAHPRAGVSAPVGGVVSEQATIPLGLTTMRLHPLAYPNRKLMALGHEKLDVYRLAIGYVAWVFEHSEKLNGVHRHAKDQWLRASQSIPLNIAEGNGQTAEADRRRYFEIARGSALECAAIQDVPRCGPGFGRE